jgi:thiol-disulfide isomerase/thioredoxin
VERQNNNLHNRFPFCGVLGWFVSIRIKIIISDPKLGINVVIINIFGIDTPQYPKYCYFYYHQCDNNSDLNNGTMSVFSSPISILGLLLLFAMVWSPFAVTAEVVTLTDQTFEHQTQASTGMTTGSWLVLFSVPNCQSCEDLKPVLEDLGRDEEVFENGVVLGSVDCTENQDMCLRFSTTKLPVLLYLHKKKLYKYPRDEEFGSPPTLEDLKSFVMAPGKTSEGEPIPGPSSAFDSFLKPILLVAENNPLAGYAIMGMAVMMGFTILILVGALIMGSGSTDKQGKTKTKSSKKNK